MRPSNRLRLAAARIINQNRILYIKLAAPGVYRAAIRGDTGQVYITIYDEKRGRGYCSCPGYALRGYCKHIHALRQVLASRRWSAETSVSIARPTG